jgi:hypothetical protein
MTVKGSLVGLEDYFRSVSFLDPTLSPGSAWLFYSMSLNASLSNRQWMCLNFENDNSLVFKIYFVVCNHPAK